MVKHLIRGISLLIVLSLTCGLLGICAFSADAACDGCTAGTFNSSPACLKDGALHICPQNFPDDNFRRYISNEFDPNGTGSLSQATVDAVEEIRCGDWDGGLGIKELTGIQYFTSITVLHCVNNELTQLDVSKNPQLENLLCSDNHLTELDVSNNPKLNHLECDGNNLSRLDLSAVTCMDDLVCIGNQIKELILPDAYFANLYVSSNQLTHLPYSGYVPAEFVIWDQGEISLELNIQTTANGYAIDLGQILDDDQLALITSVTNGTYDVETHTIYFEAFPDSFSYGLTYEYGGYYYPWSSSDQFDVTINVLCAHDWSPATISAPKTCSVCGTTEGDPLSPGKIENNTNTETNDYAGALYGDIDELAGKVFSQDELARIELGEDIRFNLNVTDITATVSQEFQLLFAKELGDYEIGAYLDISLYKQIGDNQPEPVYDTNGAVTVSLTVPEELQETGREYKVLRLHNGSVSALEASFDEKTDTLTFQSDAFSVYALVYRDAVTTPSNPETGDNGLYLDLLITVFCVCTIIVVSSNFARRKIR